MCMCVRAHVRVHGRVPMTVWRTENNLERWSLPPSWFEAGLLLLDAVSCTPGSLANELLRDSSVSISHTAVRVLGLHTCTTVSS